jgi:GTP:adenosylcobinamide-phosphate guanylyltransferase
VTTFPCEHPMEAVGINTPEELAAVEEYLRSVSLEP